MNPKVEELLKLLVADNMLSDQIMKVRDDLLSSAYEEFMAEALKSLTDDDLKAIEASATQDEANAALKKVYAEKTGKNSQDEMKRIVEAKATELIGKYKTAPEAQSTEEVSVGKDEAGIAKATDELHAISDKSAPEEPVTASPTEETDPSQAENPNNWQ